MRQKYAGIYLLTSPSGKSYVGQSVDLKHRFQCYKGLHCKEQKALYKAFLKYGFKNFKFKLLFVDKKENVTKEKLNELEIKYIKQYKTYRENGYNLTQGGDGFLGGVKSAESIQKQMQTMQNKSKEELEKIRQKSSITWFKKGNKPHNLRAVICYKDGELYKVYNSITEAALDLGCKSETSIINQLKGRSNIVKKHFTFQYKNK